MLISKVKQVNKKALIEKGIYQSKRKSERIFCWYLSRNPSELEQLIGDELCLIKLEPKVNSKKVDIFAVTKKSRVPVFVEAQLKTSDKEHLENRIRILIDENDVGIILWIAPKIQEKHILYLEELLRSQPKKKVNIYAVEYNSETTIYLDYLNGLNRQDIYYNLGILNNVHSLLNLVAEYNGISRDYVGNESIEERPLQLDENVDINECLLRRLRVAVPTLYSLQTEVEHNKNSKYLPISSGIGDVMYYCSAKNRKGFAVVEIKFEIGTQYFYDYFLDIQDDIRRNIPLRIIFDEKNRKISYEHKPKYDSMEYRINHVVEAFQKFYIYFAPILDLKRLEIKEMYQG